ncbi:MAG: CHAT domain-containing protein [Anaerolineae bacterium]|jgi:CHAT domain-containing protein/tetratricopeptide (TPR) repeat protein|nr:CHAT domain-containing protein [Anaerolineae bacterium]
MADLVTELLSATDEASQRQIVDHHLREVDEALLAELKAAAAPLLRSDRPRSLALGELILYAAERTRKPEHRALGLITVANAYSLGGVGRDAEAIPLYDEAAAIYRKLRRPVDEANAQIAKILALTNLGRHEEAFAAGRWAAPVLAAHGEWLKLGKLTANLGNLHFRRGEETQALAMWDRAAETYAKLPGDPAARAALGRLEHNRSAVLRDLGRFDEAIATAGRAIDILTETKQPAEVARCEQNLAICYYMMGRHNDALSLLNQAQAVFLRDGRERDAILVSIYTGQCLLQLHRFGEVLDLSREAVDLFAACGEKFYVAQARLNEATAYAGLGRHDEALAALAEARGHFVAEANALWAALTDLEGAAVLARLGRHEESLDLALSCSGAFWSGGLPVEQAQANLAAARAAMALGRDDEAEGLTLSATRQGEDADLPSLLYPAEHLLARLAERRGDQEAALAHAEQAMDQLGRLRRQLMIEHRAEFLEDKSEVYEDAAHLALELGRPRHALGIAERARSRALVEMLDFRLRIGIHERAPEDAPLVAELMALRVERDALYRKWIGHREVVVRGWTSPAGDQREVQAQVLAVEKRITALWRELLVRNADYIHDAGFWERPDAFEPPALPEGAALIEYFRVRGQLVAFVVTRDEVRAVTLPAPLSEIEWMLQLLQLNLRAVAAQPGTAPRRLEGAALNLCRALYRGLFAPLAELPGRPLDGARELIVVPSGALHYLPFHALHDGEGYLAERYHVGYLPSADLLGRMRRRAAQGGSPFVLGRSEGGLPHAVSEAQRVARLLGAEAFVEEDATAEALRARGGAAPLVHLATHAEFRQDNPLFSGLALADGWLTTLDIFGLELQASLVTLSGCHTGRNVIGGGEELLGLARAFFAAGASSLLLSLWAVEDESTEAFMAEFYAALVDGATKGEALRAAQVAFIGDPRRRHPYFWGAFALVGEMGAM